MALSKVEQGICLFVVQRFINEGEATRRQALLKLFRAELVGALNKLMERAALRTIDQSYNNEIYLPRATAFYHCGQPDILEVARKSTDSVLRILLALYERELDKDSPEQKQFVPSEIETEGHNLEINVDPPMVRIGLYFAEELSVFSSLGREEKQIFPVRFAVGERIYEVMKDDSPWDTHVKRCVFFEKPQNRSLERPDIPEHQAQDIGDLPDKQKLIADVARFLPRQAGIALLVIDLDHFKNVNDTKGHPEGDACLNRIVKAIGDVLGRKGVLYRWGGDEFAVALPDFSTQEAHATGERIRCAVELAKPGKDVKVTTSIGVSGSDRITSESPEDLLLAADKAMYRSKHQGKNRVTSWYCDLEKETANSLSEPKTDSIGDALKRKLMAR